VKTSRPACALLWAEKTTTVSKKQGKGQQHKPQEKQERSFSTFRDDIASLLAAQPDPHPLLHALGMIGEGEQGLNRKMDDGNGRSSKDRDVDEVGSSDNDCSNGRKALRAALLADPACPRAMQALQAEVRRAETAEEERKGGRGERVCFKLKSGKREERLILRKDWRQQEVVVDVDEEDDGGEEREGGGGGEEKG